MDKMSQTVITAGISPTFILRKIDPTEVYNNLIKGKYSDVVYNNKLQSDDNVMVNEIKILGSSTRDDMFSFKDYNNVVQVYCSNGSQSHNKIICDWCREPIEKDKATIGIPINYKYDRETKNHYFDIEGTCCKFECAYSYLKRYAGYGTSCHDPLYTNSENLLRFLFKIIHGDKAILRDAVDPRITIRMDGPVEPCKSYSYVRTPSIILNQSRVLYHRLPLK
jgi:hypothetical protein